MCVCVCDLSKVAHKNKGKRKRGQTWRCIYGHASSMQKKPRKSSNHNSLTHTHNYCATAALARPGTTKHQSMRSILDQWVQGTDREARQSKADIKGTISNNAGRIHKNKPSKSRDAHTHTHTQTQGWFQQHFQCWLNFPFEVQQLWSSNLRAILLIRRAE